MSCKIHELGNLDKSLWLLILFELFFAGDHEVGYDIRNLQYETEFVQISTTALHSNPTDSLDMQ